jgi:lysophospholipase L1-like esterase
MNAHLRSIGIKALLVFIATAVAIIVGEMVLRALQPYPGKYLTWPPNLRKVFRPDPRFVPGVAGPAHYSINAQGIRGEEFSPNQKLRVLAIGGSTTECFYQDQERTWSELLGRRLGRTWPDLNVWVGNLGKSGFNSRHHVVQMRYEVPQLPHLDTIIFLVGCNDLTMRLIQGDAYDPAHLTTSYGERHQIRRTFWFYPLGLGFLTDRKDTAWWRLINAGTSAKNSFLVLDDYGQSIGSLRERRLNAAQVLDRLPDLRPSLDEYARNLNEIIELGKKLPVRMVFMTQPFLWRADLTDAEKALLWSGGTGDLESGERGTYYSVAVLQEGMERYNRKLMEVCAQRGMECIDLAAMIPKDTRHFFDDVHFTDFGSRAVADFVAAYFEQTPGLWNASKPQGAGDLRKAR